MPDAKETLDAIYLEMRWRVLSLAADFDRIERSAEGRAALASDGRVDKLRRAMKVVAGEIAAGGSADRAEQVQMIFSDTTPAAPAYRKA